MPQVHLYISGKVQGVFFRTHTHKRAAELYVTGWTRNLMDGRVEVYGEGDQTSLEQFIEWCHHGPPAAAVENVEVEWEYGENQFKVGPEITTTASGINRGTGPVSTCTASAGA